MPSTKPKARATNKKMTYREAGVDIDAGDALVDHLRKINPAIGGFAGLMGLPKGYKSPRLVAATDGVGTKLLVAQLAGRHETIGIDLVAMVVNDLIVCGAKPLFFLDYFATGKLKNDEARRVITGIVEGCRQAGCPLIGGETAEMPGMYAPGHYDLAGFGVGIVDADKIIDGKGVKPGDILIGLGSTGLHSNGYSLARKVLLPADSAAARRALAKPLAKGDKKTLADALLAPTRIYVKTLLDLAAKFKIGAAAHITGGGIAGNLVRVLPRGVAAFVDQAAWTPPAIYAALSGAKKIDESELYKVFNMGIGMIVVARPTEADKIIARAQKLGESAQAIGWVDAMPKRTDVPRVELVKLIS